MNTSEKIKTLRLQKGLSQEELGKIVGLQKAAINKYETGRVVNIKKSMLQKLAAALDVLPADLLDDTEEDLQHDSPLDDLDMEIMEEYKNLPDDQKQLVLQLIKNLRG